MTLLTDTPAWRAAFSAACAHEAKGATRKGALMRPTDDMLRQIAAMVPFLRADNGGGGACHLVSESLEFFFGWPRLSGSYVAPDGRVLCADGHCWNVLPDGAWLDATADQFGEELGIVVVPVDDPAHARYRWAFDEDFNPGDPNFAQRMPDLAVPGWAGVFDDKAPQATAAAFGRWYHTSPHAHPLLELWYRARDTVHTQVDPWRDARPNTAWPLALQDVLKGLHQSAVALRDADNLLDVAAHTRFGQDVDAAALLLIAFEKGKVPDRLQDMLATAGVIPPAVCA